MTILMGLTAVLLTVGLVDGLARINEAAAQDAHAQIAADAAALAAVAEFVPGGSGDPEEVARSFAASNGATLVGFISGTSAVQVTVAVGDATGRARAVFDPTLLRPSYPHGS
jgi:hypothetical protein